MRLPRDLSGDELARRLARLGYEPSRQTGSHVRLTTERGGQHHVTIPRHSSLRVGTLAAVLAELAIPVIVNSGRIIISTATHFWRCCSTSRTPRVPSVAGFNHRRSRSN